MSTENPSVAEIDYALHEQDPKAFGEALLASMRDTGFAVIRNHPIDLDAIQQMERTSQGFFALPKGEKDKYAMPENQFQRGYSPFGTENAKGRAAPDLKEFWHVGRDTIPGLPGTPPVPEVDGFDDASKDLFQAMDEFGQTLMRAVGRTLEMPEEQIDAALDNGNSILRLLHYPPVELADGEEEGLSVRAAAHEDINLLTLLLGAEEAGLEVKHRSGQWMAVNPPAGSLVINAGDMLQRLTAGEIPSTTHRVVNPVPERRRHSRYSMPFFLHPSNDFMLEALPGSVARGYAPEEPITAQNYLKERLREIGLAKAAKG